MAEYIITGYNDLSLMAVIDNGITEDLIISEKNEKINVGDIVIAKVKELSSGISSAFLDLGGIPGYMTISGNDNIRPGDEILVQVIKEAYGLKDTAVTRKLSIAGKYAVVSLKSNSSSKAGVSISKKITDETVRNRLRCLALPLLDEYDIMIRTNGAHSLEEELKSEIKGSSEKLSEILKKAPNRTVFSKLFEADDPFAAAVRDGRYDSKSLIITDDQVMYEKMKEHFPDIKISLYNDPELPLSVVYKTGALISGIRERRVWLKSGAYLVIDTTEAMTVIDVNSGKNNSKDKREDTFLSINLEAAREIARQLRIRNISGMVLIDFINMKKTENYTKLKAVLIKEMYVDLCNPVFVDYTGLGLCELTRKKTRRPAAELL
ncbi:MAG: ribonuclease E/G [Lachnospiraceae bacterium]|nr:ribonuclease E/G [Lachnospiraceae bacterium]